MRFLGGGGGVAQDAGALFRKGAAEATRDIESMEAYAHIDMALLFLLFSNKSGTSKGLRKVTAVMPNATTRTFLFEVFPRFAAIGNIELTLPACATDQDLLKIIQVGVLQVCDGRHPELVDWGCNAVTRQAKPLSGLLITSSPQRCEVGSDKQFVPFPPQHTHDHTTTTTTTTTTTPTEPLI